MIKLLGETSVSIGLRRFILIVVISAVLGTAIGSTAQEAGVSTLTVNGTTTAQSVPAGATIGINVLNSTGNALDWIGIYPVGMPADSTKSVVEHYVTYTTYDIPATTAAGTYEARLFANDSLTLLATSAAITVSTGSPARVAATAAPVAPPSPTTPSLTLNGAPAPATVAPGATIGINVLNSTGNALDWIGIYPVGMPADSTKSVVEHYVTYTTYDIPATTAAGTYEARLFANDSLTLLATSAAITVSTGSPAPSISHPAMTATLLGQTGEDVVGLFSEGPDGVKDVRIQLTGVSDAITGVRITGAGEWAYPFNGYNWIVAIRAQSDPTNVDLYFDFYQSSTTYNVTVTFSDGATQTLQSVAANLASPAPVTSGCSTNCFYISPAGDDSNPGTQEQPWRTITKAGLHIGGRADSDYVDGTYTEGQIKFNKSGTATAPITFGASAYGEGQGRHRRPPWSTPSQGVSRLQYQPRHGGQLHHFSGYAAQRRGRVRHVHVRQRVDSDVGGRASYDAPPLHRQRAGDRDQDQLLLQPDRVLRNPQRSGGHGHDQYRVPL